MFTCYHCLRLMPPSDTRLMFIDLQRDERSPSKQVPVNVCGECYGKPEAEREHGGKASLLAMHGM